jgi:hypothetical protein
MMGMSENNKRFDKCRERLWKLLSNVDFSDGCKSYEGAITVELEYPNYFESPDALPSPDHVRIHLDCYVLGWTRHYDFDGVNMSDAISRFEQWLDEQEDEMRRDDNE